MQNNGSVTVKGFPSCESKHVKKFKVEARSEVELRKHVKKLLLDRSITGVIVQQFDSSLSSPFTKSTAGKLRGEICVFFRFVIHADGSFGMVFHISPLHFSRGSNHQSSGHPRSQMRAR